MASTIRVRATSSGETTEVQALIQHPMDSGFVKNAKGETIPPHFIQQLTFEHDGKQVFAALDGAAMEEGGEAALAKLRKSVQSLHAQGLRVLMARLRNPDSERRAFALGVELVSREG